MPVIARALGIGLAAAAAFLVMTAFDDGEGGANIGAGLAVFAVLAGAGFTWSLLDGIARRQPIGLGALVLRWVLVSFLAVAVVVAAMELRDGGDYITDIDASSMVFLVLLVLVPSVVGALIGSAARGTTRVPPSPAPDQTPSS
ncbi:MULTISPECIES: hypothetical protein [unclassified Knoellia]|uniref:hypothetical protein n=1 Tax=Knoellia altitudinis TaxID=3404795 RepID=UPI003619253F